MPKISQLPTTTTLNDTDVVMVVQSGVNKKAAVQAIKGTVAQAFTDLSGTTWNAATESPKRTKTLSASTSITISNVPASFTGLLEVTQDATGGRTLSINGTSVSILTTAGAITMIGILNVNGTLKLYTDLGTTVVTPIPERSYAINSAVNNITTASDADFSFTSGGGVDKPFTMTAWIKKTSLQAVMISRSDASLRDYTLDVQFDTNLMKMALLDASGNYLYKQSTSSITNGVWCHLAWTYDGSKTLAGMKMYINGALASTTELSTAYAGMSGAGNFIIGKDLKQAIQGNFLIDDLVVANKALSATEVGEAYASSNIETLSFLSSIIAGYKFNNNLTDIKGTHTGTATTPNYSTDIR